MERPLADVAADLNLRPDEWEAWGPGRAKIRLDAIGPRAPDSGGRLVLVSAITPTPAGEGKTTTAIGLAQGLKAIGEQVVVALREPSLGPIFGAKGGATGGGRSRVHPSDAIDLHFTGDLHAVTSAHNLLSALVDAHLRFRKQPELHPNRVVWPRVLDMCDRALRHIVTGLDVGNGLVREASFDITAASEVMAVLCLSDGLEDLKARLGRIIVGFSPGSEPITAGDLSAVGPMSALLRDAARPNLVQTTDGVPALIHGGPFANIAHGCSSVLATRLGLSRADWTVTEAGFAFDLGGEKFFDIKCRSAGLDTAVVVLVATVRALRHHGAGRATEAAVEAVQRGLDNLDKHVENIQLFGEIPIVALNRFPDDTPDEIAAIRARCEALGVPFAEADPFGGGGAGCTELARLVTQHAEPVSDPFRPLYGLEQPVIEKIEAVATSMYGASGVQLSARARKDLATIEGVGLSHLPVCLAKTQSSLSDDPSLRGRPRDFEVTVQGIRLAAGAGFLVVLLGDIVRMPGLPRRPAALDIELIDGVIHGLHKD
ncbi:MAG TPA: formate--tetrahydrofolate ligase [Deltaproteobacteria bacterium]|nr:formate--tetrahydrofolate ligase [Deltaproteobacteria bacterium]